MQAVRPFRLHWRVNRHDMHMRLSAYIVSIAALLLLSGCSSSGQQTFSVEAEKKRWEAQGWAYSETFGRPAEDTVMVFNGDADTAQRVTAYARTDGVLTNRVYTQTTNSYLIVAMQRP